MALLERVRAKTELEKLAVEEKRADIAFERANKYIDLAQKVAWAWFHPEAMEAMGRRARAEFEAKYTKEHNYVALRGIYEGVLQDQAIGKPSLAPVGAD